MPATAQESLIAETTVKIDGADLPPEQRRFLAEIKVVDHLRLPDQYTIRFNDQQLSLVDDTKFRIGASLEIGFNVKRERGTKQKSWKGIVVSVEPEFAKKGASLTVRGYDRGYLLHTARKTQQWKDVTYGDVVKALATTVGLTAKVDSKRATVVHKYLQQTNETHWQFLWKLAAGIDYEVVVEDRTLNFRPAGALASATGVTLEYGTSLSSFRPRITGGQQISEVVTRGWDPKSKQAIIGRATTPGLSSSPGLDRATAQSAMRTAGAREASHLVTHVAVSSQKEADELAQHTLDQMSNQFVEAEGTALGSPDIFAGAKVKIAKVGTRFGGEYTVSTSIHRFKGSRGYETEFQITGRSARTLVELTTPTEKKEFSHQLVVGIVTSLADPDKLGRVKVKFPGLGDDQESAWARLVFPHAGDGQRGIFMMPALNDEVIVGFENGDVRKPYILGCVYTGKSTLNQDQNEGDKNGKFGTKDGSLQIYSPSSTVQQYGGKSDLKVGGDSTEVVGGNKALKVGSEFKTEVGAGCKTKAGANMDLKAGGSYKLEAGGTINIKAGGPITIETNAPVTIKGANIDVSGTALVNVKAPMVKIGGGTVMIG